MFSLLSLFLRFFHLVQLPYVYKSAMATVIIPSVQEAYYLSRLIQRESVKLERTRSVCSTVRYELAWAEDILDAIEKKTGQKSVVCLTPTKNQRWQATVATIEDKQGLIDYGLDLDNRHYNVRTIDEDCVTIHVKIPFELPYIAVTNLLPRYGTVVNPRVGWSTPCSATYKLASGLFVSNTTWHHFTIILYN